MKGSKFNEVQILAILQDADTGVKVEDICRNYGIGLKTYYKWENRYGGLGLFKITKIEQLESECSNLKRINAELVMKNEVLKSLI